MRYITITNGCFDILHAGHYSLLAFCKGLKSPDYSHLIVLLDSDEKIKTDKGKNRPYFSFSEREKMLYDTHLVNEVIPFDTDVELEQWIHALCADFLVKGEDWIGRTVIGSDSVREVVFCPFTVDISTTEIEQRILQCHTTTKKS